LEDLRKQEDSSCSLEVSSNNLEVSSRNSNLEVSSSSHKGSSLVPWNNNSSNKSL